MIEFKFLGDLFLFLLIWKCKKKNICMDGIWKYWSMDFLWRLANPLLVYIPPPTGMECGVDGKQTNKIINK